MVTGVKGYGKLYGFDITEDEAESFSVADTAVEHINSAKRPN